MSNEVTTKLMLISTVGKVWKNQRNSDKRNSSVLIAKQMKCGSKKKHAAHSFTRTAQELYERMTQSEERICNAMEQNVW